MAQRPGQLLVQMAERRARIAGHRMAIVTHIHFVCKDLDEYDGRQADVLRYFLISATAHLESFFKVLVADFVELGAPYVERASALIKDIRIDLTMLRNVQEKQFTAAELVGHLLGFSSYAGIERAMKTLASDNFKTEVARTQDLWAARLAAGPVRPIIADIGDNVRLLTKAFELRHIYCHEAPIRKAPDRHEITACVSACADFLLAVNEWASAIIEPNAPMTQAEMTEDAHRRFRAADEAMRVAFEDAQRIFANDVLALLREAQARFVAYRTAEAAFHRERYAGGSMTPMMSALRAEELTTLRLSDLKRLIDDRAEADRRNV